MRKLRGLSKEFMADLKQGVLAPLLSATRNDNTLCLQIREEGINIYYRGGSLVCLSATGVGDYVARFDFRYFLKGAASEILDIVPRKIRSSGDARIWVEAMPLLKQAMDLWFGKHPKEEREYQQLVVRENNFGKCGGKTDYLICDIEYAQAEDRFDMVAIYWPSSPVDRKRTNSAKIAFIEMKYADSALSGNAGLKKHLEGMKRFLDTPGKLTDIKSEMVKVFNQMHELGLVRVKKPIVSLSEERPEFILLLADHDPDSTILARELVGLQDGLGNLPFDLRFVVSNFMGYGLYRQNVYGLDQFLARFKEQI